MAARRKRKSVIERSSALDHRALALLIVDGTTLVGWWIGGRRLAVISDRHGDLYPFLVDRNNKPIQQEA
jgi:hypothetical protein